MLLDGNRHAIHGNVRIELSALAYIYIYGGVLWGVEQSVAGGMWRNWLQQPYSKNKTVDVKSYAVPEVAELLTNGLQ